MRILIIAPPFFILDPENIGYGGTERVIIQLILGLLGRGHEVTLIACKGSRFPGVEEIIETYDSVESVSAGHMYYLRSAAQFGLAMQYLADNSENIDIVHNHVECWQAAVPLAKPFVFTHHNGWVDRGEYYAPFFAEATHVAISGSERMLMESGGMTNVRQVYNSVNIGYLMEQSQGFAKKGYAALLGRFSHEKGFHIGIDACVSANFPVKIAAKVPESGSVDFDYYQSEILPRLNNPLVEYIGVVNELEKARFLGEADFMLVPNAHYRAEPFGLVVIESFACGTPVIGTERGAIKELVGEAGVTFAPLADEEAYAERMARYVFQLLQSPIPQEVCRERATAFGIEAMTEGYIRVYEEAIQAYPRA